MTQEINATGLEYLRSFNPAVVFVPGRDEHVIIMPETYFGTFTPPTTGAGGGLLNTSARCVRTHKFDIDRKQTQVARAEIRESRTGQDKLYGATAPEGSLAVCVQGNGTPGTPADISPLLETCYAKRIVAGSAYTGQTTGGCTLSSPPANLAVGDIIGVPIMGRLVGVVVGGYVVGTGVVSFRETLPQAPDASGSVPASVQYDLLAAPSHSVTVYRAFNANYLEILVGAIAKKVKINFQNNKESDLEIDVLAKDMTRVERMALHTTVDDATTSFVVDKNRVHWVESGGCQLLIESEIVTVTGYDDTTNTLTVVRGAEGTTPTAHTASALMYLTPFAPAAAYNGRNIIDQGFTWINDYLTAFKSASIEDDENYTLLTGNLGMRTGWGPISAKKRVVAANCEVHHDLAAPALLSILDGWEQISMTLQIGKIAGTILAVDCPVVQSLAPGMPSVPDDYQTTKIAGHCIRTDADIVAGLGEHELHIAFL